MKTAIVGKQVFLQPPHPPPVPTPTTSGVGTPLPVYGRFLPKKNWSIDNYHVLHMHLIYWFMSYLIHELCILCFTWTHKNHSKILITWKLQQTEDYSYYQYISPVQLVLLPVQNARLLFVT